MSSSIDVAKKAGVSQATVSRVLNNPQSVKPETRMKVLQAMEQLQYVPNLIARSLVTNTTRTIALISGSLQNGFFAETTDSIVQFAKHKGYKTLVYFEDENKVPDLFDLIMSSKVDGVLLSLIKLDDPLVEQLERVKVPCVFFNRRSKSGGHYVVLDNPSAVAEVTRHLIGLGHRKIAYLSGKTDFSTFQERSVGFKQVMLEHGLEMKPEWTSFIDTTTEEIERTVFTMLNRPELPTAIICATDAIALICMDIILMMGLRIPQDISLAGIDNTRMASHRAVQLTTVGHQKFAMGRIAAESLFELIEKGDSERSAIQITLRPELIVRKTTGPVNSSGS